MEPVLQVALDMMQLKRSIGIAAEAVEGGADWVEVGTPLIKSEGAEAVRTIRKKTNPPRKSTSLRRLLPWQSLLVVCSFGIISQMTTKSSNF